MSTDTDAGLSLWEQSLYHHLVGHIAAEAEALAGQTALEERASGWVRFVLKMIGEDEARHHELFEQWAASVAAMGELREAPDGIPYVRPVPDADEIRPAVEALLAVEKADERALHELHEELRDVKDTTLWDLLVGQMMLDNRKHQRMLRFLLDHLE